jgi:hypothetical protein
MPYTVGPRQTFEALPTAEYHLTLKSWKEVTEQADTEFSKKGDIRVQWDWIVKVPNADDQERRDWTNIPTSFSDKSNFVHIAIALRIVDSEKAIEEGATIDPDQGIGKSCLGTIVKSLKKDNKTWTDKITQYAPLPLAEAPAKPKEDMATKLRARLNMLRAFAGETEDAPKDLNQQALRDAMQIIGAQPMTQRAIEQLQEQIQMANMMGINDFDDTPIIGLTLKDGLLMYEKIATRLEA